MAFFVKHKRSLLTLLVALVLLVVAFTVYVFKAVDGFFESSTATPSSSEYSAWTGIWLPETINNFQAYGEGWQDWLVEARFELPSEDLVEFLEKNTLVSIVGEALPESRYDLAYFVADGVLERYELLSKPNAASATTNGFYPSIWLDRSRGDTVIIFIVASDT